MTLRCSNGAATLHRVGKFAACSCGRVYQVTRYEHGVILLPVAAFSWVGRVVAKLLGG